MPAPVAEEPLTPNEVYKFEISLEPMAYLIKQGHRLRLEIVNGDSPATEILWSHYYRPDKDGVPGGLDFPGDEPPDYRDFLYYSFVIGCAAQTADVATTSRDMRMVSLIHGVVAFAFNTAILALMINVGASLLS